VISEPGDRSIKETDTVGGVRDTSELAVRETVVRVDGGVDVTAAAASRCGAASQFAMATPVRESGRVSSHRCGPTLDTGWTELAVLTQRHAAMLDSCWGWCRHDRGRLERS